MMFEEMLATAEHSADDRLDEVAGRGISKTGVRNASLLGTIAVAVAMLGPGFWSVDARLYGWSESIYPTQKLRPPFWTLLPAPINSFERSRERISAPDLGFRRNSNELQNGFRTNKPEEIMGAAAFTDFESFAGTSFLNASGLRADQLYFE